jgi:solute carrier family 25 (mitochondrial carnitine/acylcarnitine transporter), member 20/29
MTTSDHDGVSPRSDAWIDFLAGWFAGAASVIGCQPIDTILTRYQAGILLNSPKLQLSTASVTLPRLTLAASWQQVRSLYQSTGSPKLLWRGSVPMIVAVPLQNSMLMGGYGLGQQYAAANSSNKGLPIFIGGCTGGIIQSFLMSPVELIKVKQQTSNRTILQAFREQMLWQAEAPTAAVDASAAAVAKSPATRSAWFTSLALFNRGLGATILRDGIPHGVWFLAYELTKDYMLEQETAPSAYNTYRDVTVPIVSGAWAATVAWAVGYPTDLIKTRIRKCPHD